MERTNTSDEQIVALYWQRSESAIGKTADKYGGYCYRIAHNILNSREDAEESVNDTWLDAWNSMPPHKPSILSAFLGKITRRISIDRWRKMHAEKRGGGQMNLVLDELEDCIPGGEEVERAVESQEVARIIREFLDALSVAERRVFLKRYWHMEPIAVIARDFSFSETKTATVLYRLRKKLRERLESEGYL